MNSEAALNVVLEAIDVINGLRPEDDLVPKTPHVTLVGDGGALDSLALTTLVLAIERRVAEVTGREIGLLDETSLDSQLARLKTPTAFAELIVEKLG